MIRLAETGGQFREREVEPRRSDDLWFKEGALPHLAERTIRSTVRMGDRIFGTADPKGGYAVGDLVTVMIQKEDGEFSPETIKIIPAGLRKKKFSELTEQDFEGTNESRDALIGHYGVIDPAAEFTIIDFEYLDELDSAVDLVRLGVLKRAQLPPANPESFDASAYTVPLIGHDYPAKTPVMWNAAYAVFGINEQNLMLVGNPSLAQEVLEVLARDPAYKGGGAGVGFKEEVYKVLEELDPLAEAIGSVNFVAKTPEGKLRGYNTDGLGYVMSLEQKLNERGEDLKDKQVLLLGAGGTAYAIAFALAEKGANLVLLNRTVERAQTLADRVNKYFGKEVAIADGEDRIPEYALTSDAIVNLSKKGATGELEKYSALAPAILPPTAEHIEANLLASEVVLRSLRKETIVSDVNIAKETTPLLRAAIEMDFETIDGLPMVVNQAVEAFWLLYGEELFKKGIDKEDVRKVMSQAAFG